MIKELLNTHKFIILTGFSTISLISSTISLFSISKSFNEVSNVLDPIAEWAEIQNQCIEKTTAYEGVSSKVWSCNGGGE